MDSQFLFYFYWLINFISIRLLGLLFRDQIILGNFRLTPAESAFYAAFWLTFFVWTMWDYMRVRKVKFDPSYLRIVFSFAVNIVGIWIVSRYGKYTGIGITGFGWAFVLGGVTGSLQSLSWKFLGKRIKD